MIGAFASSTTRRLWLSIVWALLVVLTIVAPALGMSLPAALSDGPRIAGPSGWPAEWLPTGTPVGWDGPMIQAGPAPDEHQSTVPGHDRSAVAINRDVAMFDRPWQMELARQGVARPEPRTPWTRGDNSPRNCHFLAHAICARRR